MKPITIEVTLTVIDHNATGSLVRDKRKGLGLTLKQVAERSGICLAYLSALEKGDRAWNNGLFERIWGALK